MKEKSTMLKVTSIILLILGILSAAALVIGIAGVSFIGAAVTGSGKGALAAGGIFALVSLIGIVPAILNIIAGSKGIKAAGGNGNPQGCKSLGIALLVIQIISIVLTLITQNTDTSSIISSVLGLILIILYTKGASDMC